MYKIFTSNIIIKRICSEVSVFKRKATQQRSLFGSSAGSERHPSLEPGFKIYYKGNLAPYIKMLKTLSLSTTISGMIVYYVAVTKLKIYEKSATSFGLMSSLCGCVIFSPMLINLMTRRYVVQLSFNSDTKVFNILSLNIINRMKTTSFTIDQVKSNVNRPFTTFMVGRKPFFVDPLQFSDITVYEYLMGYDKIKHLADIEVTKKSQEELVEDHIKKEDLKADKKDN